MSERNYTKGAVFVMNKGGVQMVYDSAGNEIYGQILSRVTDQVDEPPVVLLKTLCTLVADEKEMMELIKSK